MRRRGNGRQQGIFLIEALVALLVMAVGLVALVKFEATLAASGSVAKQRTEATMLAQREIETLRGFVDLTAYDAYFTAGSPATLTRSAQPRSSINLAAMRSTGAWSKAMALRCLCCAAMELA